jgi:hypothetical protein
MRTFETSSWKEVDLKPSQCFKLVAYIDASFAIHNNGKLHTGIVIFIGGITVFCASQNQKCVSKIPMEVELVALSDNLDFAELFQEFISFLKIGKFWFP